MLFLERDLLADLLGRGRETRDEDHELVLDVILPDDHGGDVRQVATRTDNPARSATVLVAYRQLLAATRDAEPPPSSPA